MLYFAYGANTNRSAMAYRCPDAEWLGTAELPGYVLVFRGVADLNPQRGATTLGALWDISEDDLRALDRFEGYPRLYDRKPVRASVRSQRDRVVLAPSVRPLVYLMTQGHGLASPSTHYLETLREGYAACGLPPEQLDAAMAASAADSSVGYRSLQWEGLSS